MSKSALETIPDTFIYSFRLSNAKHNEETHDLAELLTVQSVNPPLNCLGDQHAWSNAEIYVKVSLLFPVSEKKVLQMASAYFTAQVVDIQAKRPTVRLQDHRGPAFSKTVLFVPLSKIQTLLLKIEEKTITGERRCNCTEHGPKWGAWLAGYGFYDWYFLYSLKLILAEII